MNAAAATLLMLTGFPGTVTAGAADNFTVTAHDAYGNIATGYLGTVHFTSSDPKAVLPANFTFSSTNAGPVHLLGHLRDDGDAVDHRHRHHHLDHHGDRQRVGGHGGHGGHVPQAGHDDAGDLDQYLRPRATTSSAAAASLPSYATVTPPASRAGPGPSNTTDTRALQVAGGAAASPPPGMPPTSFTVDVDLTDGQPHNLELYFLDWDKQGRSEQVQITGAATGAVLSTQTVSSFQSGSTSTTRSTATS